MGSVTLDVELEDRTLTNLTVSPIHAAIILHFQDRSTSSLVLSVFISHSTEVPRMSHDNVLADTGSWTLEELSGKLAAPKELVHRKLALWQQHGVLREEAGGRYYVVETGSSKEKMERGVMLIDSDEERDSNTTTQSEQREEKLQVLHAHASNIHVHASREVSLPVLVSSHEYHLITRRVLSMYGHTHTLSSSINPEEGFRHLHTNSPTFHEPDRCVKTCMRTH